MNIELTDLIISQVKTIGVMAAAGILVSAAWQAKKLLIKKISKHIKRNKHIKYLAEIAFWIMSAIMIPMFLYYCTYGKVTFCAILGLAIGVFVWKKLIAVI